MFGELLVDLEFVKIYMASNAMVSIDFLFVFMIVILICMRLKIKVLHLIQFENMIYLIICGFLVKIMILY
jgi:hypothetical protein